MGLVFDPILNMPRNRGLTLRATNNGDGTVTLNWSGFDGEAYDSSGTWRPQYSLNGTDWFSLDSPLPVGDSSYVHDAGALGTLYYYRQRFFDSNTELVKTSNVVSVILPEPWVIGEGIRWRDFQPESVDTVTGIRLTRASSQYLTTGAVLSEFQGASTGSGIIWRKNYNTSLEYQVGLITGGAPGAGYNVQGWGFCNGATNQNACTFWTNSNGSTVRYVRCVSETSEAGCLGFSFNAGTCKLYLDGVSQSTSTPLGALSATIPATAVTFRIGAPGIGYASIAHFGVVIFNTDATDAQHAFFGAQPYAPAYSSLTNDQKAGITRYWEPGSLVCSVSGATLTAPNGYTTQTGIASTTCRASSEQLAALPGRLPQLDTLSGVPVVFYDGYSASSSEYSSAPLLTTLSSPRFDTSEGTIINFTRWPVVSSTENFQNSAVFQTLGSGGSNYCAVGHFDFGGTITAFMRLRSDGAGLPDFDGHWRSSGVVAANTNYRDVWRWDGSDMEHIQNGVAKTVTAVSFNGGASEYYPDQMVEQNYEGNFGGGGSSCRHAYLLYFPWKLTAAQLTQVTNWLDTNSI